MSWTGLEEFKAQLRQLPDNLKGEASNIVLGAANGAEAEIKGAYAVKTGNLRDHVTKTQEDLPVGIRVIVKSTARHAHLYEYGTQARHTDIGANRGVMPARPTVIPAAVKARRRMYQQLMDMIRRNGFTVTGTP